MTLNKILKNKEDQDKASDLCASLLWSMLASVNQDGSLGHGDEPVLTHHLLLVLSAWQQNTLKGVENRAVRWFNEVMVDHREDKKVDFNPFKLIAFANLDRDDIREYVRTKIKVLRERNVMAEGYAFLSLGFTMAREGIDIFPTLVAADVLITEGSDESIQIAKHSLEWVRNQMEAHKVFENINSINGYGALVTALYFYKTRDKEFNKWQRQLTNHVLESQVDGLWSGDEEDDGVSLYQSTYLFYDLAKLYSLKPGKKIAESLAAFLESLLGDKLQDKSKELQGAMLACSCLLRGFSCILGNEERKSIVDRVMDHSLQQSIEFGRIRNFLEYEASVRANFLNNLKSRNFIPVNPQLFNSRDLTVDDKKFFILMPFGEKEWRYRKEDGQWKDDKYNFDLPYYHIIEPTVSKMGFEIKRADSIYSPEPFMQKIWQDILSSCLVIADLTSANPNVLYELGLAHTIGKPVVLLTQHARYIPADLKAMHYITYSKQLGSEEELKKKLRKAIRDTLGLQDDDGE